MELKFIKNIKCIIFDFDETLYNNKRWNIDEKLKYYRHCVRCLVELGLFKSESEAICFLDKKYPDINNCEHKCVYYLIDSGQDTKVFKNYLNENVYDVVTNNMGNIKLVNFKNLYRLSKKCRLFLLSDSPEKYISCYAKQFNLDLSIFEKQFNNNWDKNDISKAVCMKEILAYSAVNPDEILMVGDSELSDITPAKKLGFQTFKVDTVKDTDKIIEYLLKIQV